VKVIGLPIVLFTALWCLAALWIDGPSSRPAAALLCAGFVATAAGLLWRLRPLPRALLAYALLFGAVLVWWLSIPPSNERDWLPEVAELPHARIEGDLVTISNVRNFHWRSESDFEPRWEERRYDLDELVGVDIFLSYWGSPMIAHTIASWEFADGPPLAISIETRKERGEAYSAVLGFFRQFELYYVVGDERDLVGLRTNHRGEQVYLYRLKVPVEAAREILLDYLAEVNRLAESPRWYNASSHNCTTEIRHRVQHVGRGNPLHWKLLVNGYIDELGYERGQVDTSLPFEELRRRSEITDAARAAGDGPDFSQRIRAGLPGARRD